MTTAAAAKVVNEDVALRVNGINVEIFFASVGASSRRLAPSAPCAHWRAYQTA